MKRAEKLWWRILEGVDGILTLNSATVVFMVSTALFILVVFNETRKYKTNILPTIILLILLVVIIILSQVVFQKTPDSKEATIEIYWQKVSKILTTEYQQVRYEATYCSTIFKLYQDASKKSHQKLYAKIDDEGNIWYAIKVPINKVF